MSITEVKRSYEIATHLSTTAKGGVVIAAISEFQYPTHDNSALLRAAVVGDLVKYPDGSTAEITSGAGYALVDKDRPFAIVGSHVNGGDKIIKSPINYAALQITESDNVQGFLVEGWRPDIKEPL